jgi:hypothetical protein
MNLAIATKLNVLESSIVRVEEWANVLFVVVKGLGARFVSKKVVEEEKKKMEYTIERQLSNGSWATDTLDRFVPLILARESVMAERQKRPELKTIEEIFVYIQSGKTIYFDCDWYAQIRAVQAPQALKQPKPAMMVTSTGDLVSADDWDSIEGSM